MQINAPQINFQALVTPQAPVGATPQLNAEAATAQNANSFARMLQNRQQGAALQATAMERRAAEAPVKAPPQAPAPTTPQTAASAQETPTPDARNEKPLDRTASSRLPQRSDGTRTQNSMPKAAPTTTPQAPDAPEKTTDDDIRADPADGPVVGLSEWWVPVCLPPKPTPTVPGPVDNAKGADAALSDLTARQPIRVGPLPDPAGGVKTDAPTAVGAGVAASAELTSADTPICLAPEAAGTDAATASTLLPAAADTTIAPTDTQPSAAGLIAGGHAPSAATRTPAATLRADRDDAIGRADGARNAATPIAGSALESLPRGSTEAARAAGATVAPVSEGRSFAETLAAAAPAGVPTARSEGGTAAAPVAVSIATPATAPEFREALGVQVSLLVKDGVQSAELHLNPADMGPISVQITTDGTQAQVDFGADSATTRQIIEQGLPELAGALRDAGITLTGGGVSQHARGQSDDARSDGDGRRSTRRMTVGGSDAAAPAVRSVQTPRGQVDLYA